MNGVRPVIELELNTKPKVEFEYTKQDSEMFGKGKITITSLEELSKENKYQYYVSTSNTELVGGKWLNYTNKEEFSIIEPSGKYYAWVYPVSDINGKINDNYLSTDEPYVIGEIVTTSTKNYAYSGKEEIFIVPQTGIYQLEVWGAAGGIYNKTTSGYLKDGYGGYATGNILLNENDEIYINVGGQGKTTASASTKVSGG